MEPVFRVASVDDPDAHALLVEYFAMRAAGFDPAAGSYRTVFPDAARFTPPAGVFLLVEDGGFAAGCGGIRMLDAGRAEVKHLFLRESVRGRGWGRALLAELERRAVALGARETVLDTNADLAAASALYRSSGYATIPPYNDNPNATHWFRKALGPLVYPPPHRDSMLRLRLEAGTTWPAIPRSMRSSTEPHPLDRLDAFVVAYASATATPAYLRIGDDAELLTIAGSVYEGHLELTIGEVLRDAPESLVASLGAYAAAAVPSYLHRPEEPPAWPSRSQLARIRGVLAMFGDSPAPGGWNTRPAVLMRNAYGILNLDRRARRLSGLRIDETAVAWAEAHPPLHEPRWFPSWRSRLEIQERDREIWAD